MKREHTTLRVAIVFALTYLMVWTGMPTEALAEMVDEMQDLVDTAETLDVVELEEPAEPSDLDDGQFDDAVTEDEIGEETTDDVVVSTQADPELLSAVTEVVRADAGESATSAELLKRLFELMVSGLTRVEDGTLALVEDAAIPAELRDLLAADLAPAGVNTTFVLVARELGIECVEVEGADEAVWTMVQVDGAWYHVDTASAVGSEDPFAWLLVSDAAIEALAPEHAPWHALSPEVEVPAADESYVWEADDGEDFAEEPLDPDELELDDVEALSTVDSSSSEVFPLSQASTIPPGLLDITRARYYANNNAILNDLNVGLASDEIAKELQKDKWFQAALVAWKKTHDFTGSSHSEVDYATDMKGYYEAIIFMAMKTEIRGAPKAYSFAKDVSGDVKTITSSVEGALEEAYMVDASNYLGQSWYALSASEQEEMVEHVKHCFEKQHKWLKNSAKASKIVADALKEGKNLYGALNNLCGYMKLVELADGQKALLRRMCDECPTDTEEGAVLKMALDEAATATESVSKSMQSGEWSYLLTALKGVGTKAFDAIIDSAIEACPAAHSFMVGARLGDALSTTFVDIAFSTDALIEQYEKSIALTTFYDLARTVTLEAKDEFSSNESAESAQLLLAGIDACNESYLESFDYYKKFYDLVYKEAKLGGIFQSERDYQQAIERADKIKNKVEENRRNYYRLFMYDLHDEDPDTYELLFGDWVDPFMEDGEQQAQAIAFDKSEYTVYMDDAIPYVPTAAAIPAGSVVGGITYTSTDESVLTIDPNGGGVTPKQEGVVTITATTTDGKRLSASTRVKVVAKRNGNTTNPGVAGARVIASGTCGDEAFYRVVEGTSGVTLYIFGEGATNGTCYSSAWANKVESIVIGDGITTIGDNLFYREYWAWSNPGAGGYYNQYIECYPNVTSLVIGKDVAVIGSRAFQYMPSLKKLRIPGNVKQVCMYAFKDCAALDELIIEKGVEQIATLAFDSCEISKVHLPTTLQISGSSYAANDSRSFIPYLMGKWVTDVWVDAQQRELTGSFGSYFLSQYVYSTSHGENYTIHFNKASIANVIVDEVPDQTYTGKRICPEITIKDKYIDMTGRDYFSLTKGVDYTLTYSDNVNTGTATITIKGKGNYTGTKKATFKIVNSKAKSLAKATLSTIKNQTYTGKAITPKPTVKLGTATLKLNTDYRLSYKNNTKTGTATVTVTGINKYKDSVSKTFKIKYNVSKATITLPKTSYAYTGKAIKPAPTVKCAGATLKSGTHYTVTYKDNTKVGKATVTIKAKGSFVMGSKSVTFTITNDLSKATVTLPKANYAYTGKAIKPTPTVKLCGTTLKSGTDYTVAYKANTQVGTATVTVKSKGKFKGSKAKTFAIKYDLSKAIVTLPKSSYGYTGSAIRPAPTVKCAGKTLTSGTHYTVSYSANTNVGTATVTVKAKTGATGSAKKTFKITAASITRAIVTLPKSNYTYTGSAIEPVPTVKLEGKTLDSGIDYTVAYSNNIEIGTATVTITGKGNYGGSASAVFSVTVPVTENILSSGVCGTCPWSIDKDGMLTIYSGVLASNDDVDRDAEKWGHYTQVFWPWASTEDDLNLKVKSVSVRDGVVAGRSLHGLFSALYNVESLDVSGLDSSATEDMGFAFATMFYLKQLDVSGLNTSRVSNMKGCFAGLNSLAELDLSTFDTGNVVDMSYMFSGNSSNLTLGSMDTSHVKDMSYMFSGYGYGLDILDLRGLDTSSVISMERMCNNIYVNKVIMTDLDMSSVKDMSYMFYECDAKTVDLSGVKTSGLTNTSSMFRSSAMQQIEGLADLDTSRVTDMSNMFNFSSLHALDLSRLNTKNVVNMSGMFAGCSAESLDLSSFDTSKVKNMSGMFAGVALETIDLRGLDTRRVTDMGYMFSGCENLRQVDLSVLDTSSVTNMERMFRNVGMENLDASCLDTTNVKNMYEMFYGSALREFDFGAMDLTSVENMTGMFCDCDSLKSVEAPNLYAPKLTAINRMFMGCSALEEVDFSGGKFQGLENIYGCFARCASLKKVSLDGLNAPTLANTGGMFYNCSSLESLDLSCLDMTNVQSAKQMYEGCGALDTWKIGSKYDVSLEGAIPTAEVNGHLDWYSSVAKKWCDEAEIASVRKGVADTYLKHS